VDYHYLLAAKGATMNTKTKLCWLIMGMVLCAVMGILAAAAPNNTGIITVPDGKGGFTAIQGYSQNGRARKQLLTVASITFNNHSTIAWGVYAPTACSYRLMTSATKVGMKQTLPVGSLSVVINPDSYFTNFTGCTLAEYGEQPIKMKSQAAYP
jgi:hypothetical protein